MEATLEFLLELVKYLLPALTGVGAAWVMYKALQKDQHRRDRVQIRGQVVQAVLPMQLQAYERCVLFLERISPTQLILRCDPNGKTARQFQLDMVTDIRAEYEHNIAQQIYLTFDSWVELAKAKEFMLNLVNESAKGAPAQASGTDLAKVIFNRLDELEELPPHRAIAVLKSDFQKIFRY